MFTDGGGPSTKEIIEQEFLKQKKFIEDQFSQQNEFISKLITETQLEIMGNKAIGVLNALESRYDFISAYEGLGSCLSDEDVAEITQRVEYFLNQQAAFEVKHFFDAKCPKLWATAQALESQKGCYFLLYTYLIIEEKRHQILTLMISLLANSEDHKILNYGYNEVLVHQRKSFEQWLSKWFQNRPYFCAIFHHHKDAWDTQKIAEMKTMISHFAPNVQEQQCQVGECKMIGFNFDGNDIKSIKNVRSINICQWTCENEPLCAYWTFEPSTKTCFLKYAVHGIVENSGFTSGPKHCMTDSDREKEKAISCMENDVDFNGDFVRDIAGSTIEDCELRCQRAGDCKYFTFVPSNGKCHLKHSMGTRKVGTGLKSGPAWCPASKSTCFQNTVDYDGDDIKNVKTSNADQCQEQCQKHPTCTYFTYVKSQQKCHLKFGTGTRRAGNADMISGPKHCACGRYGGHIEGDYILITTKASNVETCFKICQSRTDCKGWTFGLDDNTCLLYDHRKHYKWERMIDIPVDRRFRAPQTQYVLQNPWSEFGGTWTVDPSKYPNHISGRRDCP